MSSSEQKGSATENIYARVSIETKAALEQMAAENGHGLSAEIREILVEAVREAGRNS